MSSSSLVEGAPLGHLRFTTAQLVAFQGILDNLTCTVCNELYSTPMTTDCQHSFCEKCLPQALRENSCAICQRPEFILRCETNSILTSCVEYVQTIRKGLKECGVILPREQVRPNAMTAAIEIEPTERAEDDSQDLLAERYDENATTTTTTRAKQKKKGYKQRIADDATITTTSTAAVASSPPLPTTQQIEQAKQTSLNLLHQFLDTSAKFEGKEPPSSPLILLSSSMSSRKRYKQLSSLVERFHSSKIIDDVSLEPTHLIVGAEEDAGVWYCKPTPKYYYALSAGIPIWREQWLDECERQGRWVTSGDDFQVYSRSSSIPPTRPAARTNLFQGMTFLIGPFSPTSVVFTKQQCMQLIEVNGGKVLDVGGSEDGADIKTGGLKINAALRAMGKDKVILVGHPKELNHEDDKCAFCRRVYAAFKDKDLSIVESAWVMLCLERLSKEPFSAYALA